MERTDHLLLEVVDFKDPQHWRRVLKDSLGNPLQDHEVSFDRTNAIYTTFPYLDDYLDLYSSPDDRISDQVRLLEKAGRWLGQNIFGPIGLILLDHAPVTVNVLIPPEAHSLMYLPLELAYLDDRPLALNDISLVFQEVNPGRDEKPVGERLRVLGVFSLPTDVSALALRRERYQLMKLLEGIAQNHGKAIDLRILQYGTTRDTLRNVLAEEDGWDLIHFSGHGDRALLVLEDDEGTQDPIDSKDLQRLLRRTKHRVKLITLSSCLSAAATIKETKIWLGLDKPEQIPEVHDPDGKDILPSVASALVKDLDCAVLAMRYPVGDEFAIRLSQELYDGMLRRGQSLTSALQVAMTNILEGGYSADIPPLSVATPALFGRRAANLTIKPPEEEYEAPETPMAYFPNEPERFVGRLNALGRANKALATKSKKTGVLFHGMAGAGKTACALELAYHYYRSHRFRTFVWYQAPREGDEIFNALQNLAVAMETQIHGFKMVHVVDRKEDFDRWLPHLTETLEKSSILVVLDNLESLLTEEGKWRDERWCSLIKAMMVQEGQSRIVLTSRIKPADIDEKMLQIESVHALSLDEALLLAREMPNLSNLLLGKSIVGGGKGRELAIRVLKLVQGHPKLIELADARAADPLVLEGNLEEVSQGWGDESHLESFFKEGESIQSEEKFLDVLRSWTHSLSKMLPEASRMLFHFLCALEEPDRQSWIVEQVWPELWRHLGPAGQAPNIDETLQELKALVDVQVLEESSRYIIHPGVAEASLLELKQGFREQMDNAMADFWRAVFEEAKSKEIGDLVAWVGLSVIPYLLRQNTWDEIGYYLQEVIVRDPSQSTIAAVLPMLRHLAEHTEGTENELNGIGLLARGLLLAGQMQEAEAKYRSLMSKSVEQGDFYMASAAAGDLSNILRDSGKLNGALELLEVRKGYTHQAGMGPWTQLANESKSLQILNMMGKQGEVLETVERLRVEMDALPEQSKKEEGVWPWNIKEAILDAGLKAAIRLKDYDHVREINAEIYELKRARGANDVELAKTDYNDYIWLLDQKRYDHVGVLLQRLKKIFEKENDIEMLAKIFFALGHLGTLIGQNDQAMRSFKTALRYNYLIGNVEDISASHDGLAICFANAELGISLAHHLAADIISFQINSGWLAKRIGNLRISLLKFTDQSLPASFDQLCSIVEEVEGVKFRNLFYQLAGPEADGDQVMHKIIEMTKAARHE